MSEIQTQTPQRHKHYGDTNLNIRVQGVDWTNADEDGINTQERAKRRGQNTRIKNALKNYNIDSFFELLQCRPKDRELLIPHSHFLNGKEERFCNFSYVSREIVKVKIAEYGFQLGDIDEEIAENCKYHSMRDFIGIDPDDEPTWTKKPIQYDEPEDEEKHEIDYSKRGFAVEDFDIVKSEPHNVGENYIAEISMPEVLSSYFGDSDVTTKEDMDYFRDYLKADSIQFNSNEQSVSVVYKGDDGWKRQANVAIKDKLVMAVNSSLQHMQQRAKEKTRKDFRNKFGCKL